MSEETGAFCYMAVKYYAVRVGKTPGIYNTWDECKEQVDGFPGAVYKSFKKIDDAFDYMKGDEASTGIKPEPGEMIAYVDGSYEHLLGAFSYGLVAFVGNEVIRDCAPYYDDPLADMRNVAGEIKGAEAAMKLAIERKCHTLQLYHDYEGIAKWPLGEWKTNKEGTKAYREFYDSIKPLLKVVFHKVTGHSGDTYNEEADKLAKRALENDL